ncbi:MAG: SpvB/TcaC N-terminal domain-containing protein [Nitrospira sp.]
MDRKSNGKPADQHETRVTSSTTSQSNSAPAKDSFQISAPTISLPKGGGAIRGIGEKFTANPVTGTGSMSVPIAVSPGRGGFGPQLSLSYDSGAGNGPFGLGWNLSLPSIARKTDKGLPRYLDGEDSDTFILAGAEDLVPTVKADGTVEADETVTVYGKTYRIRRYQPRIEGLFALIERWVEQNDPANMFWRTISRDNVTTWYGRSSDSRIMDPTDETRIFQWFVCETYDDKGNVATYHYQRENGANVDKTTVEELNRLDTQRIANYYPDRIHYGNLKPFFPTLSPEGTSWMGPNDIADQQWMFKVVFDYTPASATDTPSGGPADTSKWHVRADPFSTHRAGFEVRTYRLCRRVLMFHRFEELGSTDCLVRSTDFKYLEPTDLTNPEKPGYTVLTSVTQRAYQKRSNSNSNYESRQLPPVMFTYSEPNLDATVRTIASSELENLPVGTQGPGYQWVDLDGEGLSGVLTEQAGIWYYKSNLGDTNFGPLRVVASKPAMAALVSGRQQFMDLAGDGEIDLVDFSGPTPGFHERDLGEGWKQFVPFASLPNIDWNDANLRFVDLTGDGHADALITEEDVFTWYPSLAEDGFGAAERSRSPIDERTGPRMIVADGTQTIFLADMCGDGLTDLVRIRNGEVCYWPNLGYGRFGRKVTLANAPRFDHPDLFDPSRIRLADIDGSGPIDIIYVGRDGARLYFNRSGNSLSEALTVSLPVATHNLGAVQVADLLGNGTACLVWNSHLPADTTHPVRYIDLLGNQKPHLLTRVENNLGAGTTIEYRASTRFYVEDSIAGTPWVTRLSFPVHCVSKVTVEDRWRRTRFSSTYSYHHGYFDGIEREFRGFGRVEQVDIERFDDPKLDQPPVKTITWYHTGAALDRRRILAQFSHEYFPNGYQIQGNFHERALPEPELPADLTAEEWRQALRACKGMVLRQEIYELDPASLTQPTQHKPLRIFSSAMHNCRIHCLQRQGANRHAVFLVTESEALTYHYELPLPPRGSNRAIQPDPRIAHQLNLRHDEYGNPQQSVAIGYRRRQAGDSSGLPRPELLAAVQAEEHIAYTEIRYTGDVVVRQQNLPSSPPVAAVRHRRLRLPCETLTYELTGLTGIQDSYFTPEALRGYVFSTTYPPTVPPGNSPIPVVQVHYHQQPPANGPAMRLVEHTRTLYFADDLKHPLPLGQLSPHGLVYEQYKLALTEALLNKVFGNKLMTSMTQPTT